MEKFIELSPDLEETLQKVVRAGTSSVQLVFRAKIILLSAAGKTPLEIKKTFHTSFATIRKWLGRFKKNPELASLDDSPRSGRPYLISALAKCEVVKLACSDIQEFDPSMGNSWTIKNLQEGVHRNTGALISKSEISRLLNHRDLRPHRVKMWLHSPDPRFKEKVNTIASLYLDPPKDAIVLCIDEKSGMQAIERKKSISKKGQIRLDHEYKRNGTQTLIASFEPQTGRIFAKCGKTRKKEDIDAFMEEVALKYPKKQVYVIWDNLNIHQGYRWNDFNRKHHGRFHFIYTPVHGSWINQIEVWFGILQRKVLKNASFTSEEALRTTVLEYIDKWNEKEKHPFNWQFRGYIEKAA